MSHSATTHARPTTATRALGSLLRLATLCLAPLFGQASAAAQVGPNTCWGTCGWVASGGCGCDYACARRGDCCPDKDTFCYAQTSTVVGALVDPFTQPTALYGTDLGVDFAHTDTVTGQRRNELLFGDTWRAVNAMCLAAPAQDDSIAVLSYARPASLPYYRVPGPGASVPKPTFFTQSGGGFAPILVSKAGQTLDMSYGKTPIAGFVYKEPAPSTKEHVFATFMRSATVPCLISATCGGAFQCIGFYCQDPTSSQSTASYRAAVQDIEIAYRPSDASPTAFTSGATFRTNKFIAANTASVTHLDAVATKDNYAAGNETLLMWGRPYWNGTGNSTSPGSYARLYLLKHSLSALKPSGGVISFAPQYFTGTDASGNATWSTNQSQARCLYGGAGSGCFVEGAEEISTPDQTEIVWVAGLAKWVMLYGGDLPEMLDNPHSPADEPAHGAIHVRTADRPWGPWSTPVPILFRHQAVSHMACDVNDPNDHDDNPYPTGAWVPTPYSSQWYPSQCVMGDPFRPDNNGADCSTGGATTSRSRGNFYAPNVIDSWTDNNPGDKTPYPNAAQIFWNVSTWNPYEVVLVSSRLELQEKQVKYSRSFRVRSMYDQRFLTAATGKPNATSRKVSDTNTPFTVVNANDLLSTQPALVGDTVYLMTAKGYVTRSGSGVIYTSSYSSNSRWKIVGVNAGNGTGIRIAQTTFMFESPSDGNHLKTRDDQSLVVYSGAGTTAHWRMSWECGPQDTCP